MLGRIPSLVWGVTYLALIPTFAAWYESHSGQFFHTTATAEGSTLEDQRRAIDALKHAIARNYVLYRKVRTGDLDDVLRYTTSHADVEFTWVGFPIPIRPDEPAYAWGTVRRSFNFTYDTKRLSAVGVVKHNGDGVFSIALTPPINADNYGVLVAFPCRKDLAEEADHCLVVERDDLIRINAFIDRQNGRPTTDSAGQYWRMLYFSAMTITTVGYGDIVPLTTSTRMVVTLEAILGPVVIGLFLNSLVREAAQP